MQQDIRSPLVSVVLDNGVLNKSIEGARYIHVCSVSSAAFLDIESLSRVQQVSRSKLPHGHTTNRIFTIQNQCLTKMVIQLCGKSNEINPNNQEWFLSPVSCKIMDGLGLWIYRLNDSVTQIPMLVG